MAMKVGITVDEDLMRRADEYADKNFMSRSGLFTLALNQYLTAQSVPEFMREITLLMRKIADKGTVDSETLETLEDLERFCKLFGASK